jgi:excinuclease UvrABC nuclease subunit
MAVFCCALNVLRSRRRGFDYNFHNRFEKGVSGLYAFWLDSGACLYVGESGDIGSRMYQHRLSEHNSALQRYFKAFSRQIEVSYFILIDSTGADRRRLEQRLIVSLRPFTNVKGGNN